MKKKPKATWENKSKLSIHPSHVAICYTCMYVFMHEHYLVFILSRNGFYHVMESKVDKSDERKGIVQNTKVFGKQIYQNRGK